MSTEHAVLSASAAHRWMECPGSIALSEGVPRRSSAYADEGTLAHAVLETILLGKEPAADVDTEMRGHAQDVADAIREVAQGGLVMSEQRVDYNLYLQSDLTAFGTADAIVVGDNELQVHDLKYGRGERVSPDDNPQLKLYALGALASLEDSLGPFETVRLFIHQPRAGGTSEWPISTEALKKWGVGRAQSAAISVRNAIDTRKHIKVGEWSDTYLKVGESQCRWCPAKATCPAIARDVLSSVSGHDAASIDEFDALPSNLGKHVAVAASDWLAKALDKADLIEGWIKAVRAEAETRLLAGTTVPGWKLVQGRQGDRAWRDKAAVEELLKVRYRLKVEEMYDLKLINPTSAEKLAEKKVLGPRQWTSLQEQIVRAPGKISIAPESDKRAAATPGVSAEEFETLC